MTIEIHSQFQYLREIRPVPLTLPEPCVSPSSSVHPRRRLRNSLLDAGITEIIVRIHRSHMKTADIYPLNVQQKQIDMILNRNQDLEQELLNSHHTVPYIQPVGTGDFEAEPARSHPAWDTSGSWIRSIACYGNHHEEKALPTQLSKIEMARHMKEIFEYSWLTSHIERTAYTQNPRVTQYLDQKQDEKFFCSNFDYALDHSRIDERPEMADLVWNVTEDIAGIGTIRPLQFQGHSCHDLAKDLERDPATGFLKMPVQFQQYFQQLLTKVQPWQSCNEPTLFEIEIRENPHLDPRNPDILCSFCPTRGLSMDNDNQIPSSMVGTDADMTSFYQVNGYKNDGYSPTILNFECLSSRWLVVKDGNQPVRFVGAFGITFELGDPYESDNARNETVLADKMVKQEIVFQPLSISPGFGPNPRLHQDRLTPESLKIRDIALEFQGEIADWNLQQDPEASQDDLDQLRQYVHPLLPMAWRDDSGSPHTCLEHATGNRANWALRQIHKHPFGNGVLPGLLNDSSRLELAETILKTLLHNLDWPVRDRRYDSVHRPKIQQYSIRLQNALREFVISLCPDQNIAILASQDPFLDFVQCSKYLLAHPENRHYMKHCPLLLQIVSRAWAASLLLKDTQNEFLEQQPAELQNSNRIQSRIDRMESDSETKELFIHLLEEALHTEPTEPDLFKSIPEAKKRRILSSLPAFLVTAGKNTRLNQAIPFEWNNLAVYLQKNGCHLVAEAAKLPIERIPQNPAEWYFYSRFAQSSHEEYSRRYSGNKCFTFPVNRLRKNLWPEFAERLRKRRDRYPDPMEHAQARGFSLENWTWQMDLWMKDLDNTFLIDQAETLISQAQEAEEYHVTLAATFEALKQSEFFPYLIGGIQAKEFLKQAETAIETLLSLSSPKKIAQIKDLWSRNSHHLTEIQSKAAWWPLKAQENPFCWMPVLAEPAFTPDRSHVVTEICEGDGLRRLAEEMANCIGGYSSNCLEDKHNTHILEVRNRERDTPILTISVIEFFDLKSRQATLHLSEAKAFNNTIPTADHQPLIDFVGQAMRKALPGYNAANARTKRNNIRAIYLSTQAEITPMQETWCSLEKWKILREIWNRIPVAPEITENRYLHTDAMFDSLKESDHPCI